MAKTKLKTKTLTLEFPANEFEDIIESYAKKTGYKKSLVLPKKHGIFKRIRNKLTAEEHVAKILEDRLISLCK